MMSHQTLIGDRRRLPRGSSIGEPSRTHLVSLILGSYREMPGLCLHLTQAARLFGLSDATCRIVLDDLVNDGLLCRLKDGQYSGRWSAD
jgi:hypothetical protein